MTARLPDAYFADMYSRATDPWQLADRWYERRKYAITMAMLPAPRYRHAFEPGCSVGVLTGHLAERCDAVTAIDVAQRALDATADRLLALGHRDRVTLRRASLDEPWPAAEFDLVVLSEVAYYLSAGHLRGVLDREVPRLATGTTVIAAHWRHPVADYPLTGDAADAVITATRGLTTSARYVDDDVVISILTNGIGRSVAAASNVPGALGVTSAEAVSDGCAPAD